MARRVTFGLFFVENALFYDYFVEIFCNIKKKHYLCTIKITNNRLAQVVKHCTKDMTTQEFTKKIENGEAKVLTLEDVEMLKGKTIHTMFFGYRGNYLSVDTFVVGDVVAENKEGKMMLLNGDGAKTYIYLPENHLRWCGEDVFVCSDDDRKVYFVEA